MWYINSSFPVSLVDGLSSAGFTLHSTGGVVRMEKYGCAAEFRRTPDDRYILTELPAFLVCGEFAELWDAGYQKFLLRKNGVKYPATRVQLSNLRKFNEELRTCLGVPTYYNEALGSTCMISAYDRLKGRPGGIPDETVGATPGNTH
jgi:hypothetical protein